MFNTVWQLTKDTVSGFINDDALSRGAAMAFYAVTSLAPILLIVVAIAGLVFGHDAAQNALVGQFQSLMGDQTAELLKGVLTNASKKSSGILATIIGTVTLLVTASGVFGEMQSALNTMWKAKPPGTTITRLIRTRAASLGLVGALGFLLLASLAISAGLSAFGDYLNTVLPFGKLILTVVNTIVSFVLISVLFATIYKVLPDRDLEWADVIVGAAITALLFTIGKSLIGKYLGTTAVGSTYGAAGALIIVLLWIYYSSEIFLLGAEFTKVYAARRDGLQNKAAGETRDVTAAPAERSGAIQRSPQRADIQAVADDPTTRYTTIRDQKDANDWAAIAAGMVTAAIFRRLWSDKAARSPGRKQRSGRSVF